VSLHTNARHRASRAAVRRRCQEPTRIAASGCSMAATTRPPHSACGPSSTSTGPPSRSTTQSATAASDPGGHRFRSWDATGETATGSFPARPKPRRYRSTNAWSSEPGRTRAGRAGISRPHPADVAARIACTPLPPACATRASSSGSASSAGIPDDDTASSMAVTAWRASRTRSKPCSLTHRRIRARVSTDPSSQRCLSAHRDVGTTRSRCGSPCRSSCAGGAARAVTRAPGRASRKAARTGSSMTTSPIP